MVPLTPMILIVFSNFLSHHLSFSSVSSVQILSKSKLEKCEKVCDSVSLNCSTKIVINMAVHGESSGGKASIVAGNSEGGGGELDHQQHANSAYSAGDHC
ncbi:hapless 2 [Actinidia rufa]|uniref:Hapless 2 n=1 Tax=Actinidia rufa TaxID=165716 RepID=A0A7J0DDX2_9ERIC|nr:hapless 2 [Actinidia rufa]